MEEIMSLIFHGCELARGLESNLNLSHQQYSTMSKSCDEIVRVFSAARDRLNGLVGSTSELYDDQQTTQQQPSLPMTSTSLELGGVVQEWLMKYGSFQGKGPVLESGTALSLERREQPRNVADYGRASSSSQRVRRRKDDVERRTVMAPAPQTGNTEMPPEDGYTWRKYGQKEILGSRFPRGYYRCTHQKLYDCPAKKQVQRLDNDPFTYEVTYRGDHTCHMSSTAPSAPPPHLMTTATHILPTSTQSTPSSALSLGLWLRSMTSTHTSTGGGAGPSSSGVSGGRDGDPYMVPVADLADVMFNSGSSSNASMDLIFSSLEDKSAWDQTKHKHDNN